MRFFCIFPAVMLASLSMASAQDQVPKAELFAGYSYFYAGSPDAGATVTQIGQGTKYASLNGWSAEVGWSVNHWLGFTGDLSGYYGGPTNSIIFQPPNCVLCTQFATRTLDHQYVFLFGPRIFERSGKVTEFAHALFGVSQFGMNQNGSLVGSTGFPPPPTSGTGFAMALGLGADLELKRKIAWRLQADYLPTRFSGAFQHNLRLATGPVFWFGK